MDEATVSGRGQTQCRGHWESAHPHQAAFPGDRGSGHRASIPQWDVSGTWQPRKVSCWAPDVLCPLGPQESERRPTALWLCVYVELPGGLGR